MVQTADLGIAMIARVDWLNRPRDRSLLLQRQMRGGSLITGEVRLQDAPKTSLIEHDDVIQDSRRIDPINRST
jgi:hypothetical protein